MMEWTSVKNWPPPRSEEERLVYGPEIGFQIATFVGRESAGYLKILDHSQGSIYRWYPDGIPGVIYWMPLPGPPEGWGECGEVKDG